MDSFVRRYKCCFVGDYGAGKTCFIRSVLGIPLDNVRTTLGIDFFTASMCVRNERASVTFWDTAGAERYRSLMHSYIRDSDIVFVVYDITSPDAMSSVERCLRDLEQVSPSVVAVVGTKSDLGQLTHDVHETIQPWTRQQWKIVTCVCSSRQPASTKKIVQKCLRLIAEPLKPGNIKLNPVRLKPTRPPTGKCCA